MPMAIPSWFGFERGWLARALKALREDPSVFAKGRLAEAQMRLGLGNQQVYALEHWLRALQFVMGEKGAYRLTERALIISDWDPQLEEPGTWYAIHYWLASNRDYAFSYWCAVNLLPRRFSREELQSVLACEFPGKSRSTYANHLRAFLEVVRRTPLGSVLGLFVVNDESVSRESFDPAQIPSAVVSYALCDWRQRNNRTTAAIAELEQAEAPGRIFAMGEATLNEHLNAVSERYSQRVLWVSRTAGLNSLAFANDLEANILLLTYYYEQVEGLSPTEALTASISARSVTGGGE